MTETLPTRETSPGNDSATKNPAPTPDLPQAIPAASHFETGTNSNNPVNSKESGGRNGPDPTRYGDWEKAGRCIDF